MGLVNGNPQYQDVLAAMSPEEREAYLEKKREERALKKAIGQALESKADSIAEGLMELAMTSIEIGKDDKEQALHVFSQLYDRLHGKPLQELDVTSKGKALPMVSVSVEADGDD